MKYIVNQLAHKIILIEYARHHNYDDKTCEMFYVGNITSTNNIVELFHLINNKYNKFTDDLLGREPISISTLDGIINDGLNKITIYEIH